MRTEEQETNMSEICKRANCGNPIARPGDDLCADHFASLDADLIAVVAAAQDIMCSDKINALADDVRRAMHRMCESQNRPCACGCGAMGPN